MIEQVETKWYDVEIIRSFRKAAYHESVHHPCRFTRGRAGWELLKATQSLKARQLEFVALCEEAVPDTEIRQFLKSQSLNIFIP